MKGVEGFEYFRRAKMILRKAKIVDETHLELSDPIRGDKGRKVVVSASDSADTDRER